MKQPVDDLGVTVGQHLTHVVEMLNVTHFGANVKICAMVKDLQHLAEWLTNGHAKVTVDSPVKLLASMDAQQTTNERINKLVRARYPYSFNRDTHE